MAPPRRCRISRRSEARVRKRATMPDTIGRTRGRLLSADVTNTALRILREKPRTWREASDAFYLTQRIPNAGGPVLCASACWYEPLQPFLHQTYIEWTRSLTPSQRARVGNPLRSSSYRRGARPRSAAGEENALPDSTMARPISSAPRAHFMNCGCERDCSNRALK